ncbi:oligodendrocyte-myelin glycoprotein [Chamaea fasciata]|uniref:oligodendrocyte-myelin glycoprotein n=1 Tax=Chamaea fasciata TaxID=190680 RepID=UPI00336ACCDF
MEYQILNTSTCLLVLLVFIPTGLGICPPSCKCSGNDRNVDCSGRNLTVLPQGLQDNLTYLNLSFNQFVDLDHQLTRFTNLRTLDISNNWLKNVPAHLPKSLWELYATNNNIKVLQKLDTAYQWNLRVLDVSRNMVERAVLINNTLSSLKFLNLSSNKLWTVPTNMPYNIETVDLSNNFLSQILPGTLVRLQHLTSLYLHNNKFSYIPDKAFDQLSQLQVITLYSNPWSCSDNQTIPYVLQWAQGTAARVVGVPCAEQPRAGAAPALPTAPDSSATIRGAGAADREAPAAAPRPTKATKTHKQLKAKEAPPLVTQRPPGPLPGTERPAPRSPAGPQEAAATRTILLQASSEGNASLAPATAASTTPVTLSITSGMPTNLSKMPQSTTAALRKEEATPSAPDARVPSRAGRWHVGLLWLPLLHALAVAVHRGLQPGGITE